MKVLYPILAGVEKLIRVVNFFRVLSDEKDKLVEVIGLTPFSREKDNLACRQWQAPATLQPDRHIHMPIKEC